MNTHIYSQSQQSPAMAHDMHNQLPSINHSQHQHSQHNHNQHNSYSHPHSHSASHSNSSNSSHSHPQPPPPQHSQHSQHPQHQSHAQHHPSQLPAMSLPPPHGYSDQYAQHQQHQQHPQHSQHSQHPSHQPPSHSQHPQHQQPPHAQPHPSHPQQQHSQHPQQQPPPPQHARAAPPPSPQTQQPAPAPQVQQPPPPAQPPTDAALSPTSPSQESTKPTPEQEAATRKALEPIVGSEGTRSYRLDVVQQPKRARMCGFGDKDRRPITPPPCVRIVVTDIATGKEVDCNEIEHTMFVLNVDLWSEDALKEVNLVRHTTTTPSISSTTPASYEQVENTHYLPPPRESGYNNGGMYGHHSSMGHYGQSQSHAHSSYAQGGYVQSNGYNAPSHGHSHYGGYHGGGSDYGMAYSSQNPSYGPPRVYGGPGGPQGGGPGDMMPHRMVQGSQPQGMFTRNLIGSLAASAFRLQDPADKIGIWFVLQDLSVRTEGNFRLRFSFVNVGPPNSTPGMPSSQIVNTGKAPVLASCFSDVFTVYSAKKFPGVCESTVLSKTFATQGIKIPIRKEGAGKNGRGEDDDDYE